MGNCLVLRIRPINTSSKPRVIRISSDKKLLRVVKTDGKILEYRASILVKDLLLNLDGCGGVSLSQSASAAAQHLPSNYELRVGHVYYLLPVPAAEVSVSSAELESSLMKNRAGFADGAAKRIKVIITKQQLEELLSKKISMEDVLASVRIEEATSVDGGADSAESWRPKLETIAEGNE